VNRGDNRPRANLCSVGHVRLESRGTVELSQHDFTHRKAGNDASSPNDNANRPLPQLCNQRPACDIAGRAEILGQRERNEPLGGLQFFRGQCESQERLPAVNHS
jgi:hypothetical protein